MQDKSSQSVLKIQIINMVRFQKLLSGSLDSRGRSAVVQPRPGMQARDPASSLLEGLSRISGPRLQAINDTEDKQKCPSALWRQNVVRRFITSARPERYTTCISNIIYYFRVAALDISKLQIYLNHTQIVYGSRPIYQLQNINVRQIVAIGSQNTNHKYGSFPEITFWLSGQPRQIRRCIATTGNAGARSGLVSSRRPLAYLWASAVGYKRYRRQVAVSQCALETECCSSFHYVRQARAIYYLHLKYYLLFQSRGSRYFQIVNISKPHTDSIRLATDILALEHQCKINRRNRFSKYKSQIWFVSRNYFLALWTAEADPPLYSHDRECRREIRPRLFSKASRVSLGLGCRLQMIQKTNSSVPVRFGDRMLFVVSLRPPGQSDILPASQILFTILKSRLQIFLNCKYIQTTHRQYTARDRYTSFRTLMQDKSSQSVLKIQIINMVRFQKLLSGSLDSRGRSAVVQPRPGMQARDPASSLLEGLSSISGPRLQAIKDTEDKQQCPSTCILKSSYK
ncbi:Hypothetical_protein [Hexamita inflata]|uniref:Hypothetical_protein n=1 Tax=Hexamita inflata TaxID=28002 RepID=A0AA86N7D1_9EUKA|nr:Hypothetical protein HINF_LOCUS2052 [Hexamita inflata]